MDHAVPRNGTPHGVQHDAEIKAAWAPESVFRVQPHLLRDREFIGNRQGRLGAGISREQIPILHD